METIKIMKKDIKIFKNIIMNYPHIEEDGIFKLSFQDKKFNKEIDRVKERILNQLFKTKVKS